MVSVLERVDCGTICRVEVFIVEPLEWNLPSDFSYMHQSIQTVLIPPGNRGTFAHVISPGGEAFAILSRPGVWALAYPGATPGHMTHVNEFKTQFRHWRTLGRRALVLCILLIFIPLLLFELLLHRVFLCYWHTVEQQNLGWNFLGIAGFNEMLTS